MEILGLVDIPLYIILLTVIFVTGYIYYTWHFSVWKEAGIPHPRPLPIIGTFYTIFQYGFRDVDIKTIAKYGKVHGVFEGRIPGLVVGDPELLKEITVKEFSNFTNRRSFPLRHRVLKLNVLDVMDDHWKLIRNYITPTFSSGKMRKMAPLISHAADHFVENLEEHYKEGKEVTPKDIAGHYTMEVIASTSFGIQLDTYKDNTFVQCAKKVFEIKVTSPLVFLALIAPFLEPILDFLGFTIDDVPSMLFLEDVVKKSLAERKASKTKNVDFLKLMVDAENEFKNSHSDANGDSHKDMEYTKKRGLTTDEVTAQAITFLLAGYETTASTLSSVLYFMAVHPELQEKVFQEIESVLPDEEPNYDNVHKLQYLDQFIDETLRLYPPASRSDRIASKDMEIKGIKFPKGVIAIIPIIALHTEPDVWPDPHKFDPDRFSPEAKEARDPFYYMPFGAGPRNCIGMRLAQIELKIALVKALRKFKFVKTANTPIPLPVDKSALVFKPLKEPMVGLELRT